jgi:formiminoglutamase
MLHIDAHLDVRDTLGSGMPFRVIAQSLAPLSMAVLGLNPMVNTREHAEYFTARAPGVLLGSEQGLARWLDGLPADCVLCCSFDVDCLDASCAPGVSARNPVGLSVAQAASILRTIASDARLACLDFMELCPPRDNPAWTSDASEPGITARAVAHLLLVVLYELARVPLPGAFVARSPKKVPSE